MSIVDKKIARSIFSVKEKQFITPHYVRIVFSMSDEQVEQFSNMRAGDNNKVFIPAEGASIENIHDEQVWNSDFFVARRTYTARKIDNANKVMWVDFVAHGDNGPASRWASRAVPGSVLGVAMKERNRSLVPVVDEYLLVADSTAIPVISVILEQLPPHATAHVIAEVHSAGEEIAFSSEARVTTQWIYNSHPEQGSKLADTVKANALPQGNRYTFIAAEYTTVKTLREYLKQEQGWSPDEFSAVSYWKAGASEDQSAQERRSERQG